MIFLPREQQKELIDSFKSLDGLECDSKILSSAKRQARMRGAIRSTDLDTIFR